MQDDEEGAAEDREGQAQHAETRESIGEIAERRAAVDLTLATGRRFAVGALFHGRVELRTNAGVESCRLPPACRATRTDQPIHWLAPCATRPSGCPRRVRSASSSI